jgi:hypothetical protein
MNRSSPADSDPRRKTISGVTVIVGLVLVVLAGAGCAVAMYLALGPFSLRRDAAARLAAESTRQTASPAATGEPRATTRGEDVPAEPEAATTGAAHVPEGQEVATHEPHAGTTLPATAGMDTDGAFPAERVADSAAVPLTKLSPLEIVGTGGRAGDWRGSLKLDGQVYENAVLLRPAEAEDVAQIAFAVQKRFTRLAGFVALVAEDSADPAEANRNQPQAVFLLYGDGNLMWQSGVLAELGARREFECEIRGVEVLTLVAESQTAANSPCFVWGDVRLLPAENKAVPESEHR